MTEESKKTSLTIHQSINLHNIASLPYKASNLDGLREELRNHPDYKTLFKQEEAAGDVGHDISILSPAAYFVDLMRLIDAKGEKTWEELNQGLPMPSYEATIYNFTVSPDGSLFAATSSMGLFCCTAADGVREPWQQFNAGFPEGIKDSVASLAVSANGQTLYVGTVGTDSEQESVFRCTIKGEKLSLWENFGDGLGFNEVNSLAVMPDGRTLFAGTEGAGIFRRNNVAENQSWFEEFNEGLTNTDVKSLVVTPDGRTLFAGTEGAGVFRCNISEGQNSQWERHDHGLPDNSKIRTLLVTPDGITLFARTQEGRVFRSNLKDEDNAQWHPFGKGLTGIEVRSLAVSPDGLTLFAGTRGSGVFRCELTDRDDTYWLQISEKWADICVYALALTPDGSTLFACTDTKGVLHCPSTGMSIFLSLENRRPDLKEIPLDAETTTTEVPYLEIVNEVMRKKLEVDSGKDALGQLATSIYPFNLPYNAPLEQIRICLAHFGVKLSDIYETFGLSEDNDAWISETLNLAPDELKYLVEPNVDTDALSQAYGIPITDAILASLGIQSILLTQTDLTQEQSEFLLQIDTPSTWLFRGLPDVKERDTLVYACRDRLYKLTGTDEPGLYVSDDDGGTWKHISIGFDDYAFVRQIAAFDGDLFAACTYHGNYHGGLYRLIDDKWLRLNASVMDDVYCVVAIEGRLFAGNNPFGLYVSDNKGNDWKKARTSMGSFRPIKHVGQIGRLIYASAEEEGVYVSENNSDDWKKLSCTGETLRKTLNLDYIDRFLRLAKGLQWSFSDLYQSMIMIGATLIKTDADNQKDLAKLAQIKHFQDKFKIPVEIICSFFSELPTTVLFTQPEKALFDRVFNDPPFYHADENKAAPDPGYLESASNALTWKTKEQDTQNQGIRSSLLAALNVGNNDLQAIVDHVLNNDLFGVDDCSKSGVIKLYVLTLTRFYRFSKMAKVLGMGVQEYLLLLKCITGEGRLRLASPEVSSLDDLHAVQYWANWLKEAGLSVYQLEFLTTGTMNYVSERHVDPGCSKDDLSQSINTLYATLKSRLIKPQSFAKCMITAEEAVDVVAALQKAKLVVDPDSPTGDTLEIGAEQGKLVRCPLSAASAIPGKLPRITHLQVIDALANSPAVARYLVTFSPAHLKEALNKTDVAPPTDLEKEVESILRDLKNQHILDKRGVFTDGPEGSALFEDQPDLSVILPKNPNSGQESRLEIIRRLMMRRVGVIRTITDILNLELDYEMQSTIQQLAATFNQDWHQVATAVDYLNHKERSAARFLTTEGLQDAALLLYLVKALNLSAAGLKTVLKYPTLFGFDSFRSKIRISIDVVQAVHAFAELVDKFEKQGARGKETAGGLGELAKEWSVDQLKEVDSKALATLSGWKEFQIKALQSHFGKPSKTTGVFVLTTMKRCLDLATKLGVDVQMLIQLCKLHDDQATFDDYSAAAHSLLGVVKSKYSDEEWEKVFGLISDHLNERERDALVGLLMYQLSQDETVVRCFDGMNSLQDLSDYLLIDVEMSGVAKVSKLKQGLNTLQRYIQRCHMGLEADGKVTIPLADKEWAWRSHYRLWEANRKVFLYPENYLDPGLRKLKTPLYKELEDELLQNDITDEAVTRAYTHYFDRFDELAGLRVVDKFDAFSTRYYLGKTQSNPAVYYYRIAELDFFGAVVGWQPWIRIPLTIHACIVGSLYYHHRLHIFWLEKKEIPERDTDDNKITLVSATMKFSRQGVSGEWCAPQTVPDVDDLFIARGKVAKAEHSDEFWDGDRAEFKEFTFPPGCSDGHTMRICGVMNCEVHLAAPDLDIERGVWHSLGNSWPFSKENPHVQTLKEQLITAGPKGLLSAACQQQVNFSLSSPYAIYNREIFFHIPFLIADTLNSNQRFEEAQKWYHYIFNPMQAREIDKATDDTPFWRYLPFKHHTLETLEASAKNKQEVKLYTDDPFDPHAIAGLRLGAYEKAIVMKYIDNLLDWGDQLFAQDSWESIVQASMLYVMAENLLGARPKQTRQPYSPPVVMNYAAFRDSYQGNVILSDPFHMADKAYFPVAANANFASYWDRAEGRLFKIRHCMNIEGIVRQLALFQPPIDPRQRIRAMAAGQDLNSVVSQLSTPVPHYRFSRMIQQARSVTSTLIQLGSALLSALEKKDAEQLSLLRSTHEKVILNLTTRVKEKQIEDAGKNLDSLRASLKGANFRKDHYTDKRLITEEISSLNLMISALAFQTAAAPLRTLSVPGYLAPSIFGFSDGGSKWGEAILVAAQVSEAAAVILNQGSQLAATKAQNLRRKEEWDLQATLATHDAEQIQAQLDGATIMQEIAQLDLDMHQKSIEQAGEMETFLRTKFTNRELYQWMVGRISGVYFQTYKIAFDLAQAAEKAYQYERNTTESMITFGYWDSLKKGLLAGEGLMLGLNQLEKAYMDDNERTLEIEKTISLGQMSPEALLDLKSGGKCAFNLSEALFDRDFPGHYCRKIASIAISIPAVVGPYQNVQATLTQQTSHVALTDHIETVTYLLPADPEADSQTAKTVPGPDQLRSDPRAKQQIALSKGINDSGMFELNFRDERYLPFEGTGAVSTWELHMPRAANRIDFDTISDVIIHLRYTALDGGGHLRDQVVKLPAIKKDSGFRLISLRQTFPDEWKRFIASKLEEAKLPFTIRTDMFPVNLDRSQITLRKVSARVLVIRAEESENTLPEGQGADGKSPKIELTAVTGGASPTTGTTLAEYVIASTDFDKLAHLADICVIVRYEGVLDWNAI